MKINIGNALTNPKSTYYFLVNDILACLTIVSVASIVLETVPTLQRFTLVFSIIEWTTVAIFTLEYVFRLFVSKPSKSYIFSFYGIIDLVSIIPSYLGVGNLIFLKSARSLRIIRLLRMFRLAKLSHIKIKNPETTIGIVSLNVGIYLTVLSLSILFVGLLIYMVGSNDPSFNSVPAGMWWAFEIFVNVVTVVPTNTAAATVYVFGKFIGLLLVGILVGIVGNLFDVLILGKK